MREIEPTPQPVPDAGIFDSKNPPPPRADGKPIHAVVVRIAGGQLRAYYSRHASWHGSVLGDNRLSSEYDDVELVDGGYIVDGEYRSDRTSGFSQETSEAERPEIESLINYATE